MNLRQLFEVAYNPNVVGSGIIVDKNYKQGAMPAPAAPVKQSVQAVAKSTAPVSQAKAEPAPFNAAQHKPLLIQLAAKQGITDTPQKGKKAVSNLAVFLGQCAHETASFTKAVESMNYTDPERIYKYFTSKFKNPQEAVPYVNNQVALANRAYAGKNGNGDEASGDGWKYRGRGYMHLTGRGLYAEAGRAIHPENPNIYVDNPELVSSNPVEGAKTAIWYYLHKIGKGASIAQASKVTNSVAGAKAREKATKIEQQKLVQAAKVQLAMAGKTKKRS
jgi:putative chitinase